MPYRPTSNYRECLHLNEIPDATPTEAGVMSAADKAKLDRINLAGDSVLRAAPVSSAAPCRRRVANCTIRYRLAIFALTLDIRIDIPREFFKKTESTGSRSSCTCQLAVPY